MTTLPLGHLISPLTKKLSRQDRNTVHIVQDIIILPFHILRNNTKYKTIEYKFVSSFIFFVVVTFNNI